LSLFPDAHPDPAFPNRPDHPDMRALAEVIQDLDAQADLGVDLSQLMDVDLLSLMYLADQRLMRVSGTTRWYETLSAKLHTAMIGLYYDAFTVGVEFEKRRHPRV
jgi:hypothetical protein